MIKLPIDQKYQLNHSLIGSKKYSGLTLQRAVSHLSGLAFFKARISLDGYPSDIITIKEEPIHSIMTPFRSNHEDIYIGDNQDGITCTFTPKGNATKLTISKRSVFLNGELVEFVSKKKEPFTKGQEVILTGKALEKYFYDNPHKTIPPQGKVEHITHMDDGTFLIVFRDKTDWQMQYASSGLALISNLPFQIGDAVRLKESFFRRTLYVKKIPYGKVEAITPMDGKFLVTLEEPQAGKHWKFWSHKLELVPPKFKVGDLVRLTEKYMNVEDNPQREGQIHNINRAGKIEFYHNKQLCCYNPENLELVPQPDPIELAFKVGDKVETLSKYSEELFKQLNQSCFSGKITTLRTIDGLPYSFIDTGKEIVSIRTRYLTHQHNNKFVTTFGKPLLYYIVRKGTNAIFASKHTGKPLLVDSSRKEYEVEQIQKQTGHEHEAISTSEYKKKYIRC